jgi:hypothetical protein
MRSGSSSMGMFHCRGVPVQARLSEGSLSVVLTCGTDAGGSSVSRRVGGSQLADVPQVASS